MKRDVAAARKAFARALQTAMLDKGMSQTDLALKAKRVAGPGVRIERDTISTYMREKALPSPKRLAALARALDLTPQELLPDHMLPPAFEEDRTPRRQMRDMGDGNVWVSLDMALPFDRAMEILKLTKQE